MSMLLRKLSKKFLLKRSNISKSSKKCQNKKEIKSKRDLLRLPEKILLKTNFKKNQKWSFRKRLNNTFPICFKFNPSILSWTICSRKTDKKKILIFSTTIRTPRREPVLILVTTLKFQTFRMWGSKAASSQIVLTNLSTTTSSPRWESTK